MKLSRLTQTRALTGALAWVVVVVALSTVLIWKSIDLYDFHQGRDAQAAAVDVAKAQVVDLTTLDAASVKAKLTAMSQRSTPSFRTELTGIESAFVTAVTKNKIQATGQVDAAALVSASGKAATVLVASTAAVSSAGNTSGPTARQYRIKVDLVRSGSRWLVQGMEFVS